jgi:hypothetical protein
VFGVALANTPETTVQGVLQTVDVTANEFDSALAGQLPLVQVAV